MGEDGGEVLACSAAASHAHLAHADSFLCSILKNEDGRMEPDFLNSQRTLSPRTSNLPLSVSTTSVRILPLGSVSLMAMLLIFLKSGTFAFASLPFFLMSDSASASLNLRSHLL